MITAPPYNNTIIICKDDLPCPGNSQCVYENYELNNTKMICSCGPEWGNGGLLCDEYGVTSYFQMIYYFILVIICAVISILVLIDLKTLYVEKKLNVKNAKATTLIFYGIASIFYVVLHTTFFITYLKPNDLIMIYDSSNGYTKLSSVQDVRAAVSIVFTFFATASQLNVSILWLEVAVATNKFKSLSNPQISSRYAKFITAMIILMAISMAAAYSFSQLYVAFAIGPFAFLIIVVYGYSAYSISQVIGKQISSDKGNGEIADASSDPNILHTARSERESKMKKSLGRIRKCALLVIISIVFTILFSLLNSSTQDMQKNFYVPPTSMHIPSLLLCIDFVFGVTTILIIYWYIHTTINHPKTASESKKDAFSMRTSPSANNSSITPGNAQ